MEQLKTAEVPADAGDGAAASGIRHPCRRCCAPIGNLSEPCPICGFAGSESAWQRWQLRAALAGVLVLGLAVLAGAYQWLYPRATVFTSPGSAQVFIDGKLAGTTSAAEGKLVLERLRRGKHGLRIVAQGYEPWEGLLAFGTTEFVKTVPIDFLNPGAGAASVVATLPQSGEYDDGRGLQGTPSVELGNGDLVVYYRDLGDDVALEFRSSRVVVLNADVDQNGVAETGIDVAYGSFPDGRVCTWFVAHEGSPSNCGEYRSAAAVRVRKTGSTWDFAWRIPKRELSHSREGACVTFEAFDGATQTSRYYPGRPFSKVYRLDFGGLPPQWASRYVVPRPLPLVTATAPAASPGTLAAGSPPLITPPPAPVAEKASAPAQEATVAPVPSPPPAAGQERPEQTRYETLKPPPTSAQSADRMQPTILAEPSKLAYAGPASGMILWSGQLDKGGEVIIDGDHVSTGSLLSGELPGVEVMIQVEPPDIGVAQSPSPDDGWKRLVLRSPNRRHSVIRIKWVVVR
jgi:hypothetical protein